MRRNDLIERCILLGRQVLPALHDTVITPRERKACKSGGQQFAVEGRADLHRYLVVQANVVIAVRTSVVSALPPQTAVPPAVRPSKVATCLPSTSPVLF